MMKGDIYSPEIAWQRFHALLNAALRSSPPSRRKSARAASGGCSGTQTPSRKSEGASSTRETWVPRIDNFSRAQKALKAVDVAIAVHIFPGSMVDRFMVVSGLAESAVGTPTRRC